VSAADAGLSLREFLRKRLDLSGRKAKELLDRRQVLVNGKRVWMARHPLRKGDRVAVQTGQSSAAPTDKLEILYRDDLLIAANKPPGRLSDRHPAGVEALLRRQLDLPRLRALHRLDRDTSGVLLFASESDKRDPYLELFRQRKVDKHYLVLLRGVPSPPRQTITRRLDGKSAETILTVLNRKKGYCLAECRIVTGRTHQIRRHVRAVDCVVVGDRHYGPGDTLPAVERAIPRQMLHARRVTLPDPRTGLPLAIEATPPGDFQAARTRLGL